jgi:hypothetical protein
VRYYRRIGSRSAIGVPIWLMLPIWIVAGCLLLIYYLALGLVLIVAALVRLALAYRQAHGQRPIPPNGSAT